MERKVRSRLLLGCTGAALALGLTATALSGSAALDSGAFFVKSVDRSDAGITGMAGMKGHGAPGNPGGNPGTTTPPAIQDPTPVSATVPTVYNPSGFFALGTGKIWSPGLEVTSQGELVTVGTEVAGLRDGAGTERTGYITSYDPSGKAILSTSWWNASSKMVDGFWRETGNGYQFLGSMQRPDKPRGANAYSVSSPSGTVYYVVTSDSDLTLYRASGGTLELFRTLPTSGMTGNIAVSDSGAIAVPLEGQVHFSNAQGSLGAVAGQDVAPLKGGGFAVATGSGITRVTDRGATLDSTNLGGSVTKIRLGTEGRLAYFVGDAEVRTLDPSGKQLLWAHNESIIS